MARPSKKPAAKAAGSKTTRALRKLLKSKPVWERGKKKQLGINPKDALGIAKVSLSKVSPASSVYEALAMMDGAKKYSAYNWRSNKVIATIYVDACKRHLDAWLDGEELADDSKVPHLGHAKACLGIIIDALETGNLVDDRPPPGAASRLYAKWKQTTAPAKPKRRRK